MGKGQIARNEQFLNFLQYSLPCSRTFSHFHQIQNCHLQTLSGWKVLEFVVWEMVNACEKRLNVHLHIPAKCIDISQPVGTAPSYGLKHFVFGKLSACKSIKLPPHSVDCQNCT